MAITELALLRLQNGVSLQDQAFRADLFKAKQAMEKFTSKEFFYFSQVEDASLLYIFGNWGSIKEHYEEWIPSSANQELLDLLKNRLSVEWLVHVDLNLEEAPTDAPVVAIGRHVIEGNNKTNFVNRFAEVRHLLQDFTSPMKLAGGWIIEKTSQTNEEWILFSGWDNVAQHSKFAETASFEEYATIAEFVSDRDIKHATLLTL